MSRFRAEWRASSSRAPRELLASVTDCPRDVTACHARPRDVTAVGGRMAEHMATVPASVVVGMTGAGC